MNIYFISGLGADRRAFERIKLDPQCIVHYIDWIEPAPKESIVDYAQRMALGIDRSLPFCLVGLSFGGIISIEINRFLPAKKVILISSISHRAQLPWYFKMTGRIGLQKLGLAHFIKMNDKLMYWFFGTHSSRLKNYLKEMIQGVSNYYLQWSMSQILNWNQDAKPANVYQIHGTQDKVFPIENITADKVIEKGSHFMVITHAKKISDELNRVLCN